MHLFTKFVMVTLFQLLLYMVNFCLATVQANKRAGKLKVNPNVSYPDKNFPFFHTGTRPILAARDGNRGDSLFEYLGALLDKLIKLYCC